MARGRPGNTSRRRRVGDRRKVEHCHAPATVAYSPSSFLPGVPIVWHPGLVHHRLQQLARVVERPKTVVGDHRLFREEVAEYAQQCWIVRDLSWKTQWGPPRPLVICPTCRVQAWRLYQHRSGWWVCSGCEPWPLTRTDLLMSEYACGIRIGLTNKSMRKRHERLMARLSGIARKARTPEDLLILASAGPLVGFKPIWDRTTTRGSNLRKQAPGPVHRALAPHLLQAMVDQLLHPLAFLHRFGEKTWIRHPGGFGDGSSNGP